MLYLVYFSIQTGVVDLNFGENRPSQCDFHIFTFRPFAVGFPKILNHLELVEESRPFRQASTLNKNLNFYFLNHSRWDQKCVAVIFLVLVILWITRDVQGIFGWSLLFQPKFVKKNLFLNYIEEKIQLSSCFFTDFLVMRRPL